MKHFFTLQELSFSCLVAFILYDTCTNLCRLFFFSWIVIIL